MFRPTRFIHTLDGKLWELSSSRAHELYIFLNNFPFMFHVEKLMWTRNEMAANVIDYLEKKEPTKPMGIWLQNPSAIQY